MLHKLISGGQTGVDRAALDFARAHGLSHGGWCPKGRAAEDGVIGAEYNLTETPSADTAQRTEWNVRDSDATVVFSTSNIVTGGTKATLEFAQKYQRPVLHLWHEWNIDDSAHRLLEFITHHTVRVLNVAGPRISEDPTAARFARDVLECAFSQAQK